LRRRPVPQRARILLAGEGDSEVALGAWLNELCRAAGVHVHLDVRALGGGDPLALVEEALRQRERRAGPGLPYRASVLLLDTDRLEDGSERSSRAAVLAARSGLRLVRQRPCFEGTLLRLHPGQEGLFLTVAETRLRLARSWPGYGKPPTRYDLARRFRVGDLLRAAASDDDLGALLAVVGLR
jgi:hypothetical protein